MTVGTNHAYEGEFDKNSSNYLGEIEYSPGEVPICCLARYVKNTSAPISVLYLSHPNFPTSTVTGLTRAVKVQTSETSILTKPARNRYIIDLGNTESLELGVSHVNPGVIDDASNDIAQWSNGKWISYVKEFFDQWQNLNYDENGRWSGGYTFYYIPPQNADYPKIKKNVFISGSLSFDYGYGTPNFTIQLAVASMLGSSAYVPDTTIECSYTKVDETPMIMTMTAYYGSYCYLPQKPVDASEGAYGWKDETTGQYYAYGAQYILDTTNEGIIRDETTGKYTAKLKQLEETISRVEIYYLDFDRANNVEDHTIAGRQLRDFMWGITLPSYPIDLAYDKNTEQNYCMVEIYGGGGMGGWSYEDTHHGFTSSWVGSGGGATSPRSAKVMVDSSGNTINVGFGLGGYYTCASSHNHWSHQSTYQRPNTNCVDTITTIDSSFSGTLKLNLENTNGYDGGSTYATHGLSPSPGGKSGSNRGGNGGRNGDGGLDGSGGWGFAGGNTPVVERESKPGYGSESNQGTQGTAYNTYTLSPYSQISCAGGGAQNLNYFITGSDKVFKITPTVTHASGELIQGLKIEGKYEDYNSISDRYSQKGYTVWFNVTYTKEEIAYKGLFVAQGGGYNPDDGDADNTSNRAGKYGAGGGTYGHLGKSSGSSSHYYGGPGGDGVVVVKYFEKVNT